MTDDTTDFFPVEDDVLLDETGNADPVDLLGDFTDNIDEGTDDAPQ